MRGDVLALFWLVAKIVLLLAGLLLPGAALARVLGVPRTIATCFAGSALSLYATVLGLQLASIRISAVSLASGLFFICAIAVAVACLGRAGICKPPNGQHSLLSRAGLHTLSRLMGGWTPLYLLFWAAVLWRAGHEPLAGPDVEFRWSFLAEQMLRLGTLDFYPPRTAEHFHLYFWVESIPPGVSALHAWAYACAGSVNAAWTIPAVVLQLWSLHELLWRTAEAIGGMRAARFACLAAAACPLLTWSFLLGQETGLTALSLIGIAFAVTRWRETRTGAWAGLAGIFAALGASAREYGLVFPALAVGALIAVRADRRAWFLFLALSAISVVWPLRTWVLTGNPFYSLPMRHLFPVNDRFLAWIEHDADAFGAVLHSADGWRQLGRYFLLCAPTAVLGWLWLVAATMRRRREAILALAATVIVLALWATSVRYTNGGPFYSLRVTSPALALGTLVLGVGFAALAASKPDARFVAHGVLALLVLGMLPGTLALPRNPWRAPQEWPAFTARQNSTPERRDDTVAIVLNAIATSRPESARSTSVVLADSPGYQRRFLPSGVPVIPLWSPQADWLFDAHLSPAETVRRWRDSHVSHIILTKWQTNLNFFNTWSRWGHPPLQVQLVGETDATAIFEIRAVE